MQCSLRHFPANLLQCPALDILVCQARLALTPNLDAFQQGAGRIVAWLPHGEYRVKVHVGIDEGRRNQPTSSINLACRTIPCFSFAWPDSSEVSILNGDINKSLTTMQLRVTDDEVVMHIGFLF